MAGPQRIEHIIAPTALVTGSSRGLGRALAVEFARRGQHVILCGRNKEQLSATSWYCHQAATDAGVKWAGTSIWVGDVLDVGYLTHLIDYAKMVNIRWLVLNAAIYTGNPELVTATNVDANIRLVRGVLPHFIASRAGMVLHMNSVAGRNISPPEEAVYSASKHAMAGFLRSFRLEARPLGVRVLDVFLGAIRTPMTVHRTDYDFLIDPVEAAEIIVNTAMLTPSSLQIEELALGRTQFSTK